MKALLRSGVVAAFLWLPAISSAQVLEARVDQGALAGTARGRVVAYLGVPYAAPPVGANRWRAPQPALPWSGVRKADAFGANCQQDRTPGNRLGPWTQEYLISGAVSEDCLYLNVWTPASSASERLPVLLLDLRRRLHVGRRRRGRLRRDEPRRARCRRRERQLPPGPARLPGPPRAVLRGPGLVRQLRPAGPDRGPRLDRAQRRRVRRRLLARHDRGTVGRRRVRARPHPLAAGKGALPKGDPAERIGHGSAATANGGGRGRGAALHQGGRGHDRGAAGAHAGGARGDHTKARGVGGPQATACGSARSRMAPSSRRILPRPSPPDATTTRRFSPA